MTFIASSTTRAALLAALALAATLWPALSARAQGCTYQLSDDRITFGNMYATAKPGERLLGTRSTQLTVTCPSPQDLTLEYVDTLPDAQAPSWDLASVGRFNVRMSNVLVDGAPVDMAGTGGTEIQTLAAVQTLAPSRQVAPFANGSPLQGTTMTAQIDVTAWLDAGTVVSDATTWEGQGRLRFAASGDQVPLEVEALMSPGSCNISVDSQVLPSIPRSHFHPTQAIVLKQVRESLVGVSCGVPVLVAIRLTDNRAESVYLVDNGPQTVARSFGLGKTSQGNRLGAFQMRVSEVWSSTPGLTGLVGNNGIGWAQESPMYFEQGTGRMFTLGSPTTSVPSAMTNFTLYFKVDAYLAPNSVAQVSGPEAFDGSVTFTVEYL